MLIPRFTVRSLLILTTVSGFFCYALMRAFRGEAWAIALTSGIGSLGLAFIVYAAMFGSAWSMAALWAKMRRTTISGSPFAGAEPPAQVIPPRDTL